MSTMSAALQMKLLRVLQAECSARRSGVVKWTCDLAHNHTWQDGARRFREDLYYAR